MRIQIIMQGEQSKLGRASYELEVMILRAMKNLSKGRKKPVERRELYEMVNKMYMNKHGQNLPQSYLSVCLKSLKNLGLIKPVFDISDRDARVKGYKPTRLFHVLFGGEEIYTLGLRYSRTVLDEIEPKPKSLLKEMYDRKTLVLDINKILKNKNLNKIEKIIKKWYMFKKQKSKYENNKISIAYNDFLTLHIIGHLVKIVKEKYSIEEIGIKEGSKQILSSIIESEVDFSPNIPMSTLINQMEIDELDNIAGVLTPLTLSNYVILDNEAVKRLETEPEKIEIYYKPGGAAREAVCQMIGSKYYERNDAVEAFLDNIGSGVGLVTEAPWLTSIIHNAKQDSVRIFYYFEPLYLIVNIDSCDKYIATKIEERLKDSRIINIFNVHKTLTENINILNDIVNKYIDIINSELMDHL